MVRHAPWVAILFLLSGCAGSSEADSAAPWMPPGGGVWNGQTGSLRPLCGLPAPLAVPSSAEGLVVDTRGCQSGTKLDDVRLTTPDGERVSLEWRDLGDGRYLAVPIASVEPGTYSVSVGGRTTEVTIAAPEAQPARVGELSLLTADDCAVHLELVLDPSLVAYAPLVRLWITTGVSSTLWKDYGELSAGEDILLLSCEGPNCRLTGENRITVRAEIAGETRALEQATIDVYVPCGSTATEDAGACGVARSPNAGSSLLGGLALAFCALCTWWRRARRARDA